MSRSSVTDGGADQSTTEGAADQSAPDGAASQSPPDGAANQPAAPERDRSAGDAGSERCREHPPLWRNRDFVRFVGGQFVTNAGDSLYTVAILWLVLNLSGSTAVTGAASAMLLLPYLLQIVAGPLVDRFRVQRLLVGTQLAQGAVVLAVPAAAATGHLSVPLLLSVIPVLALLSVLMAPIPTTLVPRIVPDEQLSAANSALATVTLGLDMVFDAVGGAFVAVFGAVTLFLADSATFGLAALLFAGMAVPTVDAGGDPADGDDECPDGNNDEVADGNDESADSDAAAEQATVRSALREYVGDLRAGVALLRGSAFVHLLLTAAVANLAVGVTLAVLPAFGKALGGPAVYGALLGALGIGRLLGSLFGPRLETVSYGRLIAVTYVPAAALWLGAALVPSAALTVVLFGLAWVPAGANGVLTRTLNQTVFPPGRLGRVSAIQGTAATATLPVGSLAGGLVAAAVGARTTVALAAAGFGFVGLYHALRPSLRRLPAVTDATAEALGVEVDERDAP